MVLLGSGNRSTTPWLGRRKLVQGWEIQELFVAVRLGVRCWIAANLLLRDRDVLALVREPEKLERFVVRLGSADIDPGRNSLLLRNARSRIGQGTQTTEARSMAVTDASK